MAVPGHNSRVRTQYHFRPGKDGLDAWDVHKLIAMTADFPVKDVDLGEIWELDAVYWFNDGDEVPTVRNVVAHMRLVNEVDMSYPIILGSDGCVMDGMHRVVRALIEGHRTIKAVQFEVDPEPDYPKLSSSRAAVSVPLMDPSPAFGRTVIYR